MSMIMEWSGAKGIFEEVETRHQRETKLIQASVAKLRPTLSAGLDLVTPDHEAVVQDLVMILAPNGSNDPCLPRHIAEIACSIVEGIRGGKDAGSMSIGAQASDACVSLATQIAMLAYTAKLSRK